MLIQWAVIACVFLVAAELLPGIHVESFWVAFLAAIALSAFDFFLRPALILLTLPINILTLGLFTLVINALMILLVSAFVPGFIVDTFLWALALVCIMSVAKLVFLL